jgi:NAD(P)H-quinone oxidoreductase subunit 5
MHAGLVNAGGLLLLRVSPVLEASPAVKSATVIAGAFGALFGAGVMIVRPDAKRALGGSTVAQMSFMIMTCGLGAYAAALWHLIAHGLFKAWAFLGAGSTIGRAPNPALVSWTPRLAIMAAGISIGIALVAAGAVTLPLPLLLALVTGVAAYANVARAGRRSTTAVLGTSAGLTLSYLGGLLAIEALPGLVNGTTPFDLALQPILLGAFLTAWIWQSARLPIPAPLYVRLLNTGGPALVR